MNGENSTGNPLPSHDPTARSNASEPSAAEASAHSSSVREPSGREPSAGEASAAPAGGSTEPLLDALRQVVDPELFVNIVDLGLIYAISRTERTVAVDMTLTSPACPAGPQIVHQSKMALERLEDVDEAIINLVMSPPWSPDRMTDEARDQLGIF